MFCLQLGTEFQPIRDQLAFALDSLASLRPVTAAAELALARLDELHSEVGGHACRIALWFPGQRAPAQRCALVSAPPVHPLPVLHARRASSSGLTDSAGHGHPDRRADAVA